MYEVLCKAWGEDALFMLERKCSMCRLGKGSPKSFSVLILDTFRGSEFQVKSLSLELLEHCSSGFYFQCGLGVTCGGHSLIKDISVSMENKTPPCVE